MAPSGALTYGLASLRGPTHLDELNAAEPITLAIIGAGCVVVSAGTGIYALTLDWHPAFETPDLTVQPFLNLQITRPNNDWNVASVTSKLYATCDGKARSSMFGFKYSVGVTGTAKVVKPSAVSVTKVSTSTEYDVLWHAWISGDFSAAGVKQPVTEDSLASKVVPGKSDVEGAKANGLLDTEDGVWLNDDAHYDLTWY